MRRMEEGRKRTTPAAYLGGGEAHDQQVRPGLRVFIGVFLVVHSEEDLKRHKPCEMPEVPSSILQHCLCHQILWWSRLNVRKTNIFEQENGKRKCSILMTMHLQTSYVFAVGRHNNLLEKVRCLCQQYVQLRRAACRAHLR